MNQKFQQKGDKKVESEDSSGWSESEENVNPPVQMEEKLKEVQIVELRAREEAQYAREIQDIIKRSFHANNYVALVDPVEKADMGNEANNAIKRKFAGTQSEE